MNFNYFRAKRDKNLCVVVAMLIFLTLYCLVGAFTMDIVSAGFNQIDTLSKSTFNNGYVLNYPLKLDDEYAFPGHSIRFYKDDIKLVSTCIMELNDTKYTSNSIFGSERNVLGRDEIIISSNLVTKYNLCVGQKLKAYIPHSDDVKIYTVKGIGLDNYDITNLNLYEETGIILMGYDDEYISSINAKYIVFSNVSLAETIAQNPRSLDRVFSRLDLVINIVLQIMPILVLYLLLFAIYFIVLNKKVFKESKRQATVLLNKGTTSKSVSFLLALETALYLLPPLCVALIFYVLRSNSLVLIVFNALAVGTFAIYRCLKIRNLVKSRKKI